MNSLKAFLTERLTAAAEEIFEAVERTIAEYQEEIFRSKDLEISRLRIQLRLLKAESMMGTSLGEQPREETHQSYPAAEAPESDHCEEDGCSSMEQEQPEPSEVKKEPQKDHFWLDPDAEPLDGLESDIKDFMPYPPGLRGGLQDPALVFHPNLVNGEENKDRPYCCSVCEKRFSNCSHLAAHIRTHTGERPYTCEICRKTFVTTSGLNRHRTIHTEGKPFVCNFCGKSFKWMESLGRHVKRVHKGENVPR